jgi:hypothetical protein
MELRRGLGGERRGPWGPGVSLGIEVKFRAKGGREAWAGRGEQGVRLLVEVKRELWGEWEGDE